MTQDRRAPRSDVVDQLAAIDVPYFATLRTINKERLPPDTAKSAHGGIHSSGNVAEGFGEQLFGTIHFDYGFLQIAMVLSPVPGAILSHTRNAGVRKL